MDQSQAQEIAGRYNSVASGVKPKETRITSYGIRPLITALSQVRPMFPCEGPPLPYFTSKFWPNQFRDMVYAQKDKGKPHRQMEIDSIPIELPQIDCYVLSLKITGDITHALKNLSQEIEIPYGGQIQHTMEAAEDNFRERLVDAFQWANDRVPIRSILYATLTSAILYEGVWAMIKKLWDILVNKEIKVHLEIPHNIPGYETADFIVDSFCKNFSIDAVISVKNINWHAWG